MVRGGDRGRDVMAPGLMSQGIAEQEWTLSRTRLLWPWNCGGTAEQPIFSVADACLKPFLFSSECV